MALEGAHWWVENDYEQFPWTVFDHYQYVIRGDSVVNNIPYKKVFYRDLQDNYPYYIENEILAGMIRDDTINQKVYVIDLSFNNLFSCPKNEEFLLYNFDVSLGDTLNWCLFLDYWGSITVSSVEYELIYGVERKVVNNVWVGIEGIGSYFGIFEFGMGSKNADYSKGWSYQLIDYCLGTDQECGCQWVGIEEKNINPGFKVYPNPVTSNTITLVSQIKITDPLDIKLYDINGREFYKKHINSFKHEFTFQIPDCLSNSTSTVLLWVGNNRQLFFKKLIIKQ